MNRYNHYSKSKKKSKKERYEGEFDGRELFSHLEDFDDEEEYEDFEEGFDELEDGFETIEDEDIYDDSFYQEIIYISDDDSRADSERYAGRLLRKYIYRILFFVYIISFVIAARITPYEGGKAIIINKDYLVKREVMVETYELKDYMIGLVDDVGLELSAFDQIVEEEVYKNMDTSSPAGKYEALKDIKRELDSYKKTITEAEKVQKKLGDVPLNAYLTTLKTIRDTLADNIDIMLAKYNEPGYVRSGYGDYVEQELEKLRELIDSKLDQLESDDMEAFKNIQ